MSTFDYTSRDFSSIQDDLLSRASVVIPSWTSRDPSDFGMVLVDLWAYMGDVLHYYVDRVAGESNLQTATQRESVLSLANLLDYIPSSRTPATTSVTLDASACSATDIAPIIIPQYWRFIATPKVSSATNVIFTTNSAFAINVSGGTYTAPDGSVYTAYAKNTPFTVNVTEGERYEETYTANGQFSQKILLGNTGIVRNSINVKVAEGPSGAYVQYSLVDRLLEASSSQTSYTAEIDANDKTYITFGNNVNGKIPLTNAKIVVSYRRSRGAAGNLPAYSIKGFDFNTLPDGTSLASIKVLGNSSASIGGADSESIELMKVNIPASFRTQGRAISLTDYRDLTLGVPGVAKAYAANTGAASAPAVTVYFLAPQGNYSELPSSTTTITNDAQLVTDITNYLTPRSVVGVAITVQSTTSITKVSITANVQVKDGYVQNAVSANVDAAIRDLFSFDNALFGMKVSLGDLYRAILAVEGVDYSVITQFTTGASVVIDSSASFIGVSADANKLLYLPVTGTLSLTTSGGISTS